MDELQEGLGQGPCLDAAYEHETVRVPDMADERRWPEFSAAAAAHGALGLMAFQLYVRGDDLGALDPFSRRASAFDDESEHVGLLLAAHAAVACSAAQEQAGLRRTALDRQLVGQAQGILMERHEVTAEQAFRMLVRVSQQRNDKLREVAERLVHSGHLDPLQKPQGQDGQAPGPSIDRTSSPSRGRDRPRR